MRKRVATFLMVCLLLVAAPVPLCLAGDSTAYTYTVSVSGKMIRTQDAYLSGDICMKEAGLSQPSDIFVRNGQIYVADTGNQRVVIYNLQQKTRKVLGQGILVEPKGIFVTQDGTLYVADAGAPAVFIFSSAGKLTGKIGRPASSLFSTESAFKPNNVVVSSQGNIFIVGIGAYEGIMQFDQSGKFEGYFAANSRSLSFSEVMQNLFFSKQQKSQMLTQKPEPIANIDISSQNLIYAVTQIQSTATSTNMGENGNVKLCNLAGVNILSSRRTKGDETNLVDVAAGENGIFYTLSYTGRISEYDSTGNLVFTFGGTALTDSRSGLFTQAAAIATDDDGYLYVLDSAAGQVQIFYPTDFAIQTNQALYDLKTGNYNRSESTWENVLRLDSLSRIAQQGYGKTLFYEGDYSGALEHFKIAGDRYDYSEAKWQLRNNWLNHNVPYAIFLIIAAYVLWKIKRICFKKSKVRKNPGEALLTRCEHPLGQDIKFVFYMLRHPVDGYYYLKNGIRGSVLSSSLLYGITFLVFSCDLVARSFLFRSDAAEETSPIFLLASFCLPLAFWLVNNYMISSINEGEGTLKKIYVSTAYSLSPYLIITPFLILLTYVLTLNETFVIQIGWEIAVIWTAVLLFLEVMHIENYSFGQTVKNIILTLFLILLSIVTIATLYIMWNQLVDFVRNVWGEGMYDAFH